MSVGRASSVLVAAKYLVALTMVVEEFTEREYEASNLRELKKIEKRNKGLQ